MMLSVQDKELVSMLKSLISWDIAMLCAAMSRRLMKIEWQGTVPTAAKARL
jgi:hypothetical protein